MEVYKNILVTVDCSQVDKKILSHAARLARQNDATLHLIHVVHSHTLDQDRVLRKKAEKIIKEYLKPLKKEEIRFEVIIKSGEPDKEILKEIEEGGYDLVAMATHGHKFFSDLLFGSVSDVLKHKIDIPLLLIKG
jgi:universal stress protein A